MIRAGELVGLSVVGETGAAQFQVFFTPSMLRSAVMLELEKTFKVDHLRIIPDSFVVSGTLPWSYRAEVNVVTRVAYGHEGGPESIVATAFYNAAESMPTVHAVAPFGRGGPGVGEDSPGVSWATAIMVAGLAIIVGVVAWKL
jgi:hypothetical protein